MKRPTSVTVFGVLNMVFAGFGLLGILATLVMLNLPAGANNPAIKIMHENAAYGTWMKICIPLGGLSAVVLLTAGIGLMCLKGWARVLSIAYAIYAILFGIVGTVIKYILVLGPMLENARAQSGPEAAGVIGGVIGGIIGGCLSLIYPILLLIFMTRPKVVAAFRPPGPPPL